MTDGRRQFVFYDEHDMITVLMHSSWDDVFKSLIVWIVSTCFDMLCAFCSSLSATMCVWFLQPICPAEVAHCTDAVFSFRTVTHCSLGCSKTVLVEIPRPLWLPVSKIDYNYYYNYNRFTTPCPGLPRWVANRINHSAFCWSRDDGMAVASARPYASHLHLAPNWYPCQHC